jgi:Lar family restriction alleviation protein
MSERQLDIVTGIEHFIRKPSGIDTDAKTLKPCPFCGHPAGYYESGHQGDKFPLGVVCTNTSCGVKTPQHYQNRELAAAAWNRRAPETGAEHG